MLERGWTRRFQADGNPIGFGRFMGYQGIRSISGIEDPFTVDWSGMDIVRLILCTLRWLPPILCFRFGMTSFLRLLFLFLFLLLLL